jgi:hypothetical protein
MGRPPSQDEALLQVLETRADRESIVVLRDGRRLAVYDIAWGYDLGDSWAHVTTNVSPGSQEAPVDFFFTSEVALVIDPETGGLVFRADGSSAT